jgi:hypothetical protein
MVANFTISVGATPTTIIIKDSSTAGYGGESITSRSVVIQDSAGSVTITFPIVSGVGDTLTYDLTTVKAVKITLTLTPSVVNASSTYTQLYAYAPLNAFESYKEGLEDQILYDVNPRSVLSSPTTTLRTLEWFNAVLESTQRYVSIGDLGSAQESINCLTDLSKAK